jgi:DNA-binding transcriptional LysR family regulator
MVSPRGWWTGEISSTRPPLATARLIPETNTWYIFIHPVNAEPAVSLNRIDLNLLVYLDALLRERNVTQAANQLNLSQPAMSNGLRRLRELFDDPLLVRTSDGMTPTERALELEPIVREVLTSIERAVQPRSEFDPASARRVFRIMASDYAEATLFPSVLGRLRTLAPDITLDIMTPSDVSFLDVERGKVDMVINRFDSMPQSFHQIHLWDDSFTCVLGADNPVLADFSLENYLAADHIWVSKTGMGVGVGVNPDDVQRLGWVDAALNKLGKKRQIRVFTRHYQAAMTLAELNDLIVTVPTRAALLKRNNPRVVLRDPPLEIPPLELKMAWSPLLQHNAANRWLRKLITDCARELDGQPPLP